MSEFEIFKTFTKGLIDIMWLANQSYFQILLIFIEINFYLLSLLYDVYNEL